MKTYNFLTEKPENIKVNAKEYRDTRNGIICVEPSVDLQCYINYIDYLNLYRNEWASYGYLDLGMMPLAMAPSFMHGAISASISSIANKLNIPVYSMPPVSVFLRKCNIGENDIWVFKRDIAAIMKVDGSQVSLTKFLRWCMNK